MFKSLADATEAHGLPVLLSLLQEDLETLSFPEKMQLIKIAQEQSFHEGVFALKTAFAIKVYLGLPPDPFGNNELSVVVSHEPMHSTGDIYHIIAYIALSQALQYDLPDFQLSYQKTDGGETQLAFLRNMTFVEALNMIDYFITDEASVSFESKGGSRSNSRRKKVRDRVIDGETVLLDQKALTTILAHQFAHFEFDEISALIRQELMVLSPHLTEAVIAHTKHFGSEAVAEITATARPWVLIHIRHSGGANPQQNLSDAFTLKVANYLASQGYGILFLEASARAQTYPVQIGALSVPHQALNPFISMRANLDFQEAITELDHKKLPFLQQLNKTEFPLSKNIHLQFLMGLVGAINFQGVIGNTSGTLDIASFIGHRVLDIHHFASPVAYQDYRILMQMAVMSVVSADIANIEVHIAAWARKEKSLYPKSADLGLASSYDGLVVTTNKTVDHEYMLLGYLLGDAADWPLRGAGKVAVHELFVAKHVFEFVKNRLAALEVKKRAGLLKMQIAIRAQDPVKDLSLVFGAGAPSVEQKRKYTARQQAWAEALYQWDEYGEGGSLRTMFQPVEAADAALLEKAMKQSLEDPAVAEMIRLRKEALGACAMAYGYECHDVKADGNCFFYAASDQIQALGCSAEDAEPDLLRILVAVTIDTYQDYYHDFLIDHEGAEEIAAPHVWAGQIAINAFARTQNLIVVIIPHDGGMPQVFKPAGATHVVVLGNEVNFHFQSLRRPEGLAAGLVSAQLQDLIDAAENLPNLDVPAVELAPY